MKSEKREAESCRLCPRNCRVLRGQGEKGVCGETWELVVARAALHMWEEPCISGKCGSGAVFFSGCPLHCVFCQNQNIASGRAGKKITTERLAAIFLELQEQGACNINLVTPTHYAPQICCALELAKSRGLMLPIVYNTSGYETVDNIRRLRGHVDIFLPDFKYLSPELAERYSHAPDYGETAKQALAQMVEQAGPPVFDPESGWMERGVMVRHLALPGAGEDSRAVLKYLYETYGNQIYISILNQYTPMPGLSGYPELNRKLTVKEYEALVDYAIDLGIEQGFIQEGDTAKESFIPEFNGEGV